MIMYDFNNYLKPLWEDSVVYDESVMVVENEYGTIPLQTLSYDILEIVSVKNAQLTIEYVAGKDYTVQDGMLKIEEDGSIYRFAYDKFYSKDIHSLDDKAFPTNDGFTIWREEDFFHKRQISVTYTHRASNIYRPVQDKKHTIVLEKLRRKENLKVLFYGDSITYGWNSSKLTNSPPFIPDWGMLTVMGLANRYCYHGIVEEEEVFPGSFDYLRYINTSVSGTGVEWGLKNVKERVCAYAPDIVFIAFGMNNAKIEPDIFKNTLLNMVNMIKKSNPLCVIGLVGTTFPNPEVIRIKGDKERLLYAINDIADQDENIIVCDMTTLHKKLLLRKPYWHMTGNNVNHPNDFLMRQYATVALDAMHVD